MRPKIGFCGFAAAITAAVVFNPVASRAQVCPQFLAQYCVVEKNGFHHTAWTNPCFAKQEGLRVLHPGMCEGPICSDIYAPVCSINPATGRLRTYSNLCQSDNANAVPVHKGRCLPRH